MTGFSEDTAAPYRARLDTASFFAWVQSQEGRRYELKDGEIVMHVGNTQTQFRLASHFVGCLIRRHDLGTWMDGSADFAVPVGGDVRYPDVLVARPLVEGDA